MCPVVVRNGPLRSNCCPVVVILKDAGTTGQDYGTIIRSKWTVADDDGTVWAVVVDGQSCCLHYGTRGVVCIDDVKS